MSGAPSLTALPGGSVDQVARREKFQRARPDTVITSDAGQWTGSLLVCRKRQEITRPALGPLLDGLDALAALDAEAQATEKEFPGWRLWLSSVNRWWATRQGPDAAWIRGAGVPLTLNADDLAGLRVQLADAAASYSTGAAG